MLEARDRVGGRIWTVERDGYHVDLGGAWLGPKQDAVHALARELGIGTHRTYDHGDSVLTMGTTVSRFRGTVPKLNPIALGALGLGMARLDAMAKKVPIDAPWEAKRARTWDARSAGDWIARNAPRRCRARAARRDRARADDVRPERGVAAALPLPRALGERVAAAAGDRGRLPGGARRRRRRHHGRRSSPRSSASVCSCARRCARSRRRATACASSTDDAEVAARRVIVATPPALATQIDVHARVARRSRSTPRTHAGRIDLQVRRDLRGRVLAGRRLLRYVGRDRAPARDVDRLRADRRPAGRDGHVRVRARTAARSPRSAPDDRRRLVLDALTARFGARAATPGRVRRAGLGASSPGRTAASWRTCRPA